jgi:hypothetical protein
VRGRDPELAQLLSGRNRKTEVHVARSFRVELPNDGGDWFNVDSRPAMVVKDLRDRVLDWVPCTNIHVKARRAGPEHTPKPNVFGVLTVRDNCLAPAGFPMRAARQSLLLTQTPNPLIPLKSSAGRDVVPFSLYVSVGFGARSWIRPVWV